ncbi:MAG: branched-chain amino acid ABC transporter permease, partial [Desulfobacteraceae bacterium]|nr:branched-chain amino acid ABC transporter permease [Desulfobacteraceae bacterium]
YFAFWIWKFTGITPYVSMVAVFIILALVGFIIYGIVKKFEDDPDSELLSLVLTFGFAIVVTNLVRYFWTSRFRGVFLIMKSFEVHGMTISTARFLPFACGLLITIALFIYLKKSYVGMALRAVSQDAEAAQLMGVSKTNAFLVSLGLGCGLAGVAGALFSTIYAVYPEMGFSFTLLAFCIVVLAGLGNFKGVLIASFVLAIAEGMTGFALGSGWKPFATYLIIITALLVRGWYWRQR